MLHIGPRQRGGECVGSQLQAALEASYPVNLDRQGITARAAGVERVDGRLMHRVTFTKGKASRVYLFDAESSLPARVLVDEARGIVVRYSDYRKVDGVVEPHRVEISSPGGAIAFVLLSVQYNKGLDSRRFNP